MLATVSFLQSVMDGQKKLIKCKKSLIIVVADIPPKGQLKTCLNSLKCSTHRMNANTHSEQGLIQQVQTKSVLI